MMTIKHLHKSFKSNLVLRGIDLTFDQGEVVAILGPNGSGKTTLIKSIMGMVVPSQGSVTLHGESVLGKSDYRSDIAYLPQIARFPENLTVQEIVQMVADLSGKRVNPDKYLDAFDIQAHLLQPLRSLSGGTLQKVNLVLALMKDNPMIIMDEPTSGLDPLAMRRLRSLLEEEKAKGKTIIITTHIMHFAEEVSDRIVYLLEGKIHFDGKLSRLKQLYNEPTLEGSIARILEGNTKPATDTEQPKETKIRTLHSR